MLTNMVNIMFGVMSDVFHIDATVIGIISSIIVLGMIFALWKLIKTGI